MKRTFLILSIAVTSVLSTTAQTYTDFELSIEEYEISNAPGVQSYAWGLDNQERWVVIGGRIDGLHQRQPFASFLASDNNTSIYVVDPDGKQVWSASLSSLPTDMEEQFQSTNMEFVQKDSFLYLIGGYGYSASNADHITFPFLNRININALSDAIINGQSMTPHILQIEHSAFKVTGGHLGILNDTFYLAGGQLFDGRYNPMGPDHGPGFTQEYTEEIRVFTLTETSNSIALDHYSVFNDQELHRRDYNMAPQIFPDGSYGFTMFSGVFQIDVDLPHLNMVDFNHNGFTVINDHNQLLSQYHSAQFPLYDSTYNVMHTFFFGGISQFTLDAGGNLVEDQDVPFVKTISRMTRLPNDSMEEVKLSLEMPGLMGSGAEFIPIGATGVMKHEVLMLDRLPNEKTLIGYIYGGIESTAANIFFVNDGSQSDATNNIYKVYLTKNGTSGIHGKSLQPDNVLDLRIDPNPAIGRSLNIKFNNPSYAVTEVLIIDLAGKQVKNVTITPQDQLEHRYTVKLNELASGQYTLILKNGNYMTSKRFNLN